MRIIQWRWKTGIGGRRGNYRSKVMETAEVKDPTALLERWVECQA